MELVIESHEAQYLKVYDVTASERARSTTPSRGPTRTDT